MLQTRIPRNTPRVTSNVTAPARGETPGTGASAAPDTGSRVDLPGEIREKMESSFGADFSNVRLYESETVAQAGARAVTQGSNIAFAPGKLNLASTAGQALLGHELSHVVSQSRGESAGQGFLNDPHLEARADRQGMMAARGESVYQGPVSPIGASSAASASGPIQAKKDTTPRTKDGTDVSEFAEGPLNIVRKTDSDAVKSRSTWRQLQKESNLENRKGDYAKAAAGLRKKAAAGAFDKYDNAGSMHGDYEGTNLKWGALGLKRDGPKMKKAGFRTVVDTDAEAARMGRLLGSLAEGRELMRSIAASGAPTPVPAPPAPAPEPPAPEPAEPASKETEPAPKEPAPAPREPEPAPKETEPAPAATQTQPTATPTPPVPAVEPAVIPATVQEDTGTDGGGETGGERKSHSHSGEGGHTHERSGEKGRRRTAMTSEELKRWWEETDEDARSRKLAGGVLEDEMDITWANGEAMSAEKRRMGLKGNESISGNEAYEKYLASALTFREGGGMGDVFARGKQDPKAMAELLAEDMQRLIKMNHKALFSSGEDEAMRAHSEMLKYKRLGAGINGVIKYAQDNDQKELLKLLKKGHMAKFQRKQGRFEAAMKDAETLRDKKDRYYRSKDDSERIRLMRELSDLKNKRKAARKASKKFTNG